MATVSVMASVPFLPPVPPVGMKVKSSDRMARIGRVEKPTVIWYGPAVTCSVWAMTTGA